MTARYPRDHFAEVIEAPAIGDTVRVETFEPWDDAERYPWSHRAVVTAVDWQESPHGSASYRVGVSPEITVRMPDGSSRRFGTWEVWRTDVRVVGVSPVRRSTIKRWDSYAKIDRREVDTWRVVTLEDSRGDRWDVITSADDRRGAAVLAAVAERFPAEHPAEIR